MAFSLFSRDKGSARLALVFDIGSASVGGALALFEDEKTPKIIYAVRKDMVFQEELDTERLQSVMLKTVAETAADIQQNGISHLKFTRLGSHIPRKAYCTLASPWHATQTRMIRLKKEKPFKVTRQFIDELITKEVDAFKESEDVKDQMGSKTGNIIEKRLIQMKLNGYETPEPENKEARSLEAALFVSVSPKELLKSIAQEIRRTFAVREIEFNSFSLAAFDVLRNIRPETNDFLFLDISGEITDVSLVRSGVLMETATFPTGKRDIIRALAKTLETNMADALSLLRLYHAKNISAHHKENIRKALGSGAEEWTSQFQKSLAGLSEFFSIPSTVLFTSDKDLEGWFASLVAEEQFAQFTMTDKEFDVVPVDTALLNNFCRFSSRAVIDPFLALETVFANKT